MEMMSLPKMKLSSCLQPQLHLSSRSLLAAVEAFPSASASTRSRTSCRVRCGSARRRKLSRKNVVLEKAHEQQALGLERHWRHVVVGGVSVGLMMALVMGMNTEKAMALGPQGPLMEEFWDNVRRYGLYALTVSTGALSAVFEPIYELLKNPISAILILIILGGSFYIVSQVVASMIGLNEFAYDYGY